eukprot:GHVO01044177.1.p1 GENE.GHVO01044177.1~~GHVO01044177.1.p1  ORF type:complete len:165 (+),score=25.34 GHVO01044177.1:34-528(+)
MSWLLGCPGTSREGQFKFVFVDCAQRLNAMEERDLEFVVERTVPVSSRPRVLPWDENDPLFRNRITIDPNRVKFNTSRKAPSQTLSSQHSQPAPLATLDMAKAQAARDHEAEERKEALGAGNARSSARIQALQTLLGPDLADKHGQKHPEEAPYLRREEPLYVQ